MKRPLTPILRLLYKDAFLWLFNQLYLEMQRRGRCERQTAQEKAEANKDQDALELLSCGYNPDTMTKQELIHALANERRDIEFIASQVSEVYCEITNNQLSKPNYYARDVLQVADECFQRRLEELLKDELEAQKELTSN